MQNRQILHVDMDAFFAAIEQQRHPELRGKPIIIGTSGDPKSRGVVSTASYEARRYGIRSGMPLKTAFRLCPDCIFLPVDFEAYIEISDKIKAILSEFSSVVEDSGIDEAYLDVSGVREPPPRIAQEIRQKIREETGLGCSIGIGPNKLLAKIASDLQKPNGLTILTMREVESHLWPLPVRKLLGVGPKTESFLVARGIRTVGELASVPLDQLVEWFGNAFGSYLHEASRGIDDSPLVTHREPKSHSREVTFQKDTGDKRVVARVLLKLAESVAADLRTEGCRGRTVTVKLRFSNFETHTRSMTVKEPVDDPAKIKELALKCLERFDISGKIRLVGVRVAGLAKEGEES